MTNGGIAGNGTNGGVGGNGGVTSSGTANGMHGYGKWSQYVMAIL